MRIRFWGNTGEYHGECEWFIEVDGVDVGTMDRDTPTRYHQNGVNGTVYAREEPKRWIARYDDGTVICVIPDGSTAHVAKRMIREAINQPGHASNCPKQPTSEGRR